MKTTALALALSLAFVSAVAAPAQPFRWENATVYFMLTDRFANGDPANDLAYGRQRNAAPARGYEGGDFKGITAKIKAGYFTELGVDALWITPPSEQIHGATDEGTGRSYGFHGYWPRDFTAIDANLGSAADLHELVDTAHAHGLRVLLDVVMNHTGPVTEQDPVWPAGWVRTSPVCDFKDVPGTVRCTLVKNLPDIRTESDGPVEVPPFLAAKWRAEGRYEREMQSLDAFFARTGLARAPRNYLIKWHADWVRTFGFDGFRADTVKHVEPEVWLALKQEASRAYEDWKRANPGKAPGDLPFYMTAEVYNYGIRDGLAFAIGAQKINYRAVGFDSMINFTLKTDAQADYETLFSSYARELHTPGRGLWVLNYLSSHDDGAPFDALRRKPYESANKLLLAPGAAQIYYGDETARVLQVAGAQGDAHLRSFMNWDALARDPEVQAVRAHWSKLGRFRQAHPAIGAGSHQRLAQAPYTFARKLGADQVVVALDTVPGQAVQLPVAGVFAEGQLLRDHYSGEQLRVQDGQVRLSRPGRAVLLAAD
ncbi:alpha-amylase family glycosyl hydrolase [Massilia sp. TS11]|uniref:alpha-amylase family glycosyl hydrolase n=1 Tax=Massilia sp. TS11 TaxID=2908003 RepID=UPI001EDA06ED|nr:alpha-amylase family glycosyl hydrolase [Massilia sp. TS11]MCG2583743.1 alpha-amylase family glycosyl hydrolase [Massilia sp. TS11]